MRSLPNKLRHNCGLSQGGTRSPVERDCRKIEGHSELFLELEHFEKDLEQAVILQWRSMRELNLMIAGIEAGTERWMQEAKMADSARGDRIVSGAGADNNRSAGARELSGQVEHGLGEHVAHDLAGAAEDRRRSGHEEGSRRVLLGIVVDRMQ